jgi:hypothetical protein
MDISPWCKQIAHGRRHGPCERHLCHIVADSEEHSEEVVL